ncbi:hypothetical protein, partial [Stenotrophomonas maltophilia]|uniref:hypothetical protein n=1 Tax=Stenotrophomonas maltophilia TaxID=40324 RepID=UPI001C610E3A
NRGPPLVQALCVLPGNPPALAMTALIISSAVFTPHLHGDPPAFSVDSANPAATPFPTLAPR